MFKIICIKNDSDYLFGTMKYLQLTTFFLSFTKYSGSKGLDEIGKMNNELSLKILNAIKRLQTISTERGRYTKLNNAN